MLNTRHNTSVFRYVSKKTLLFSIDPGCERYSLSFTLRDSPTDYVNVTCWGNGTFINDIAKSFKINDIGRINYNLDSC